MKLALIAVVCLCYSSLSTVVAQSVKSGVYVSSRHRADYLQLNKKGTVFFKESGKNLPGKYESESGVVTITLEGGRVFRATVSKDALTDETGVKWSFWKNGKTGLAYEKEYTDKWKDEDDFQDGVLSQQDEMTNELSNIAQQACGLKNGQGSGNFKFYSKDFIRGYVANYDPIVYSDSIVFQAKSKAGYGLVIVTLQLNCLLTSWRYIFSVDIYKINKQVERGQLTRHDADIQIQSILARKKK